MEQKRGNAMMARFVAEVDERPQKWRTRGYGTVDGNMPWPKDLSRDLRLCSTSLKNVGNRGEWSVEEHEQFLKGLQEVGDGDWTGISREFVTTRTPTQVETHALLVFSYQNQTLRRRISTVVAETVKTSLQVAEATVRKIGDSIIPPSYNLPDSSGSHIISLASDKEDNPMHQRRVTSTEWIFICINFCLEVLSATFDQISSTRKPDFALFGLLFSVVAVFACIWELILKGMTARIVVKRWRMVWWFYYPPPQSTPFGTFTDFYGLACAITQCMVSAVQYAFLHSHVDNPIKVTILPIIFLVCLAASAIIRNRRYTNTINDHSL